MKKKVFLYVHSHWDREWYREFQEFRLRLVEVVDDVLKKLEKNEIPYFYFDGQTAAVEDYLEIYPEKTEQIKKLILEKKLSIGPFYCSADSFLVSCEFLIRNLYFGINYSNKMGCNDFIGYLCDTFGHSASIPQILKSVNVKDVVLWRGLGTLPAEFLWDDIRATYLIQGYFQDIFSLYLDFDKKAELLKAFIDKIAQRSSDDILLPCGADHLKVADDLKKQVEEINNRLDDYEIIISSPFEYLKKVKNITRKKINGEFLDESKNFLLKGVYSSRIYQKQQNAKMQWSLSRICEPLATISASLNYSKNWQNELDFAYKNIIKNHAHDSIYGCSIDDVHKDVETRFRHSSQFINGIKKRITRDLSDGAESLSVLNLSNYNFSGVIEVETENDLCINYDAQLVSKRQGFTDKKLYDSTQIPITEDITTIKKYLLEVTDVEPFSSVKIKKGVGVKHEIKDNYIGNDYLSLEIVKNKIILTDRQKNKKYNDFIEIINRADIGDSYNFGALKNDKEIKAKLISSKVLMQGHIKSTLRLIYEINIPYQTSIKTGKRSYCAKHTIYMDVSVSNLQNYLEFDLTWENKSKNHILQVRFNMENPVDTTYSEDAIGIIKRDFNPKYDIYKKIPALKGVELKTNTAPMQRFVWAQGVGLVTKGLNEYEINGDSLNLTILRSTGAISEPHNPCRGTPAGPPLICPDLQCLGKNRAQFCLSFVPSASKLYKVAEQFYGCTATFWNEKNIENFIKINNENVLLQALKLDKENNIVLRLVNISEFKAKVILELPDFVKQIYQTTCSEAILGEITNTFELEAKEIITIKCVK